MKIKIEPCKACKYLKRIPVGYVSYRCKCKLNHKLRIWDCYGTPHPKCPLKKKELKESNLSLSWLKLNKPNEYKKLVESI